MGEKLVFPQKILYILDKNENKKNFNTPNMYDYSINFFYCKCQYSNK